MKTRPYLQALPMGLLLSITLLTGAGTFRTVAETSNVLCPPNKTVECGTAWSFDLPIGVGDCSGAALNVAVVSTVTTTGPCSTTITRNWRITGCCGSGTKAWSPLGVGTNGEVWALVEMGGHLYVGGNFTTAGGASANHIAKWDGASWSPLGSGANNGMNGSVVALATMGGKLFAAGWFTTAGGVAAENIAQWDGTNWAPLGSGLAGTAAVEALAVIGTDLYAGGRITSAGGVPVNLIAKWDSLTSTWSALGNGVDDRVNSLTAIGTNVYAGGQFTTAGGASAHFVAKWNGANWSPLGSGMNLRVGGSLGVLGGNLYAGGVFTTAGGSPANRIAKWDVANSVWSALGTGMDAEVEGFAVMGSDLYASGGFLTAGGVNANRVAKWDGAAWSPLGTGMNDGVWRLAVVGTDLYAGGVFTTAGDLSANYVAKWSGDCTPFAETCSQTVIVVDTTPPVLQWQNLVVANNGSDSIKSFSATGVESLFANTAHTPSGVVFDSTGNLYVTYSFNHEIVKYDTAGAVTLFADASSGLSNPHAVIFDAAGNLYVANTGNNTIVKFTPPSSVGTVFANTGLNAPEFLAFDSAGNLHASNAGNVGAYSASVVKFDPAGTPTVFANTGLSGPAGMAFDSAGNLYLANSSSDTILKFDPAGTPTVFANSSSGLSAPTGLAFDSAGNLYASSNGTNSILAFTPAGAGTVFANTGLNHPWGLTWHAGSSADKTVNCATSWAFDAPTARDSCSGTDATISVLSTVISGDCPQLHTRTWQATDACGNTSTRSQAVTVVNTSSPEILCPPNIVMSSCTAIPVTYTPTAMDACNSNLPVVCTPPSGSVFQPGTTTTVLCRATNCAGIASCSFTVTVECATPCVAVPSNMVLWLPFDELSGTLSANLVPGGNDGGQVNGPVGINGFVANSLSFDGVNQHVEVPSYNAINFGTTDFSIEAWVMRAAGDPGNSVRIIVDKRNESGGVTGYAFFLGGGGTLACQLADGTFTNYSSALAVPNDGQWHHVAVTVDRDNTTGLVFYLDGAADTVLRNPVPRSGSVSTALALRVGSRSSSVSFNFWGSIDEVEMYNRVLGLAEIAAVFNAGPSGHCKTPCSTPLVVNCPPNKTVDCGTPWQFDLPTVTDRPVMITPAGVVTSGVCPETRTQTWQITDDCGNTAECSQTVTITSPPPVFVNFPVAEEWTETGSMTMGRDSHQVVLLPDGKVLVAGGGGTSTELYHPTTGVWTTTGPLSTAGFGKIMVLLPNGKVLIAGGGHPDPSGSFFPPTIPHADAEIYDPAAGTWAPTGSLNVARSGAVATVLDNGLVLIVGGWNGSTALASAELFDPSSGTWTLTGSLNTGRTGCPAVLLTNGRVLVAGGSNFEQGDFSILGTPIASAEEYDPVAGTWALVGALNVARHVHTATLLPDGRVLVAGGVDNPNSAAASAEWYDPGTGTWTLTGSLSVARYFAAATLLANGEVLVVGGSGSSYGSLLSAELYDPASGIWTQTVPLATARMFTTATLLTDDTVLVAGGRESLASSEIFGRLDLGCGPATIPNFDPSVGAVDGCGASLPVSQAVVDTVDGCRRTRTITYTATDACGRTTTGSQAMAWRVNELPPVFTSAADKIVECGSCYGGYVSTLLHAFPADATDGAEPHASLLSASDGKLYGLTALGGASGKGVIFCLNPDGSGYTVLKHFNGADGDEPHRALIEASDGMLYGMTKFGGSFGPGTIFRLAKDGSAFQVLHSFSGSDGLQPWASLLQASDGRLYGTTKLGGSGSGDRGVIFGINLDGTGFSVLRGLSAADGQQPTSGLVEADGGALFGTTTYGGNAIHSGTIYRINKDGSGFQVLKVFGGSDGDTGYGGLFVGCDGYLYGTTAYGGVANGLSGRGTIYKLKPDGSSFTVLHQFSNTNDGRASYATLVQDADGMLWGTCSEGTGTGMVFRIRKDGTGYQIVRIGSGTPVQGAVRGVDGAFYVTGQLGGAAGTGSILRLACSSLWDFDPPTAVDACSGKPATVTIVSTIIAGTGTYPQFHTRTWMATDECGNTSTASQIVTLTNPELELLVAAPNKTVECGTNWSFDPPTVPAGCGGGVVITVVGTVSNGSCPEMMTRTWLLSDRCGTSTVTQTVTILDLPPIMECPAREIIVALNENCQLTIPTIQPPAFDHCTPRSELIYTQSPAAGEIVPGPCHLVTVTVRDGCNNVSQCEVRVCGRDKTPPTVTCPKLVQATNCVVPNVLGFVSMSDNCSDLNQLTVTQSPPAGTAIAAGGNLVTVTVTDQAGNTTTCIVPLTTSGANSFLNVLFNTAVNAGKTVLSGGSVDPHFTLDAVAPGTQTGAGLYNAPDAVAYNPSWPLPPYTLSSWLFPYVPVSSLPPSGSYTYTTRFTLPLGVDPMAVSISGRWAVLNLSSASMYFNGHPTPVAGITTGASWSAFTINSGFLAYPAVNEISFVVTTAFRHPGLRVEFTDAVVNCETCTPPVVLLQTPDQTVPAGGTAVFDVTVWGTPALTYQWHHNNMPIANGGHYSGVNTPILTVTPTGHADAGVYHLIAYNNCGEVTSTPRKLTVTTGWSWPWAWWNFAQRGNPLKATIGPDLVIMGPDHLGISSGTTRDYDLPEIGGQIAKVMHLPALAPGTAIAFPYIGPPTPGSALENYTFIADVYRSGDATGEASLFDLSNSGAGGPQRLRVMLGADGQLRLSGTLDGMPFNEVSSMLILPDQWNRVAMVLDASCSSDPNAACGDTVIRVYLNGEPACGSDLYPVGASVGTRPFSLTPDTVASLGSSPEGTSGGLYLAGVFLLGRELPPEVIAEFGSPEKGPLSAADISAGTTPELPALPELSIRTVNGQVELSWSHGDGSDIGATALLESWELTDGSWLESFLPFVQVEMVDGSVTTTAYANPARDGPIKFYKKIRRIGSVTLVR